MRIVKLAPALSAAALLAACGGEAQTEIPVTNSGNVVLNGQQADMAFTNDGEQPADAKGVEGAPPMTDQQFANHMASTDAFQIDTARMAQERATDGRLRDYAGRMVTEHQATTERLRAALPGVTPDASLTAQERAKLDSLRATSGAEFDRLYREQQIVAHQQAISILELQAANSANPQVRELAAQKMPTLREHLRAIEAVTLG
ncbi:DUF4142 domain-containing protein [Sphingomonas sp.]